jgi:hypothetical protein
LPREQSGAKTDFDNENVIVSVDKNLHRPGDVRPCREEFAFRREDLNAAVFAVGDVNEAVAVHGDTVRHVELSRFVAGFAPREE